MFLKQIFTGDTPRMSSFKFGFITCAIALTLLACSQARPVIPLPEGDNSANIARNAQPPDTAEIGRKLYKQTCAACHKESGTGGKMVFEGKTINPDDLTSDKIKHLSDQKIFEYITDGVPDEGMPSFKGRLKEPEIPRDREVYPRGASKTIKPFVMRREIKDPSPNKYLTCPVFYPIKLLVSSYYRVVALKVRN